jgi:hypothetical protein
MGSRSENRRFELEVLEPRLLMSADPLLAAGPADPAESASSIVEANILTETVHGGLAADAAAQMDDIFAGIVQEDLAEGDDLVFSQSVPASDQLALADVALLFSAATIEGITIISHGFALTGGGFQPFGWNAIAAGGDSLLSLARAIRNRADLENGSTGDAWLIDYDLVQEGTAGYFDGLQSVLPIHPNDSGEVVLLFDWAPDSNNSSAGWGEAAGDALFSMLAGLGFVSPETHSSKGPLHFIGHSMGTVVTSEAVERLAAYDVPVDQVTYLDPHDFDQKWIPVDGPQRLYDLGRPSDYGTSVWNNVAFTDVYYQTRGTNSSFGVDLHGAFLPNGRPIPGAFNLYLVDQLPPSPAPGAGGDHSYVWEGFYTATVTQSDFEDVDNDGLGNEDTNHNDRLDAGEDLNGNGRLDLGEDLKNDGVNDRFYNPQDPVYSYSNIVVPVAGYDYGRISDPALLNRTSSPAVPNFYGPSQDHTYSSPLLVTNGTSSGTPNLAGLASLGLTTQDVVDASWLPVWSPMGSSHSFVNGNFQNAGNLLGIIPGWTEHGGGGRGSAVTSLWDGNGYLELDFRGANRTHNWFYLDPAAANLVFDLSVGNASPDDTLIVELGDVNGGMHVLGVFPLAALGPDFIPRSLPIPSGLRGQVMNLTFRIDPMGSPEVDSLVRIDNVEFHDVVSAARLAEIKPSKALDNFQNLVPADLVRMLRQLGDALQQVGTSAFLDIPLPFASGWTVGQSSDFAGAFMDTLYKELIGIQLVPGAQADSIRNFGRILSPDAVFSLQIDNAAPVPIIVPASATLNNHTLAELTVDFNEAFGLAGIGSSVEARITEQGTFVIALETGVGTALKIIIDDPSNPIATEIGFINGQEGTETPLFASFVDLAARIGKIIDPNGPTLIPAFDPVTQEVTMPLHFDWTGSIDVPLDIAEALGPIADFSTTASFSIATTLTFDLTVGFALTPTNIPRLVTTAFVPPPSNGQLHANSSFLVVIGDEDPVPVTLTAASTSTNTSLADLVATLNTALAAAGLGHLVLAQITGGTHITLAVLNEDLDGDGHLDVNEDLDNDGVLDRVEDVDGDGHLDVFEDLNGDGILQAWEDVDGDGHLDVNEDLDGDGSLGTVAEDIDHDGHLDVAEDTIIPNNGILDSLLGVRSLQIVADPADPIFTEVGFLPETARVQSRGLFLDNARISGEMTVGLSDLTAAARFSVFGIEISDGSALGHVAFDMMLQNRAATSRRVPLSELFAAANAGAIGTVVGSSTGLGTQPVVEGSLNLTLGPTITISPSLFTLPAGARIIIGVPDITRLRDSDGDLVIHSGTDLVVPMTSPDPGIWLVYPELDGLAQFSCLNASAYILALDQLVQDLGQLSDFGFLNEPLPLLNESLSDLIGQASELAQWLDAVRSNPGATLASLETNLETALNIDPSLFAFTVDDVPNPSLTPNGTAYFNPPGTNNALRFTNTTSDSVTVRIVDDGTVKNSGTTNGAIATWDAANHTFTINVNSGVTTADHVISAATGSPITVIRDVNAEPTHDGSGVMTKTALKLHFNLNLAYGEQRSFELNLADLVPLLPSGSPAASLLGGLTSFIDVEGTGRLNINASAALRIDFGLDVTNPCAPRPFLYDTTDLTLKGRVTATNLDFQAALGPLGIFVENGWAAFDLDGDAGTADDALFALALKPDSKGRYYLGTGGDPFDSSNVTVTANAAVGVALPLYFPAQGMPFGNSSADNNSDSYPDNYFVLSIPSLANVFDGVPGSVIVITPDFNSLLGTFDVCDLIQSSGVLLDGLDELLGKIENGLDQVAFSGNFPLVGDKLAQGANFIRDFRTGLLAEMRAQLANVGGDPINLVKQAVWNVLGPSPGLDILVRPSTGVGDLTGWSDLDIACDGNEIVFNLRLKSAITVVDTSANPIAMDIGLPSLGLEINGNVQIELGFDLRLRFGINKTEGFYFNTDNPDGLPELVIDLMVTTPGLDVTGSLFFLQLNVKDGHTAHIGHQAGDHAMNDGIGPSRLYGQLTVDLLDPVGEGDRLTFAEMRSGAFSLPDTFQVAMNITAEVNLDLEITFGGNAAFPRITAEFDLDWLWSNQSASGGTLAVGFNHITVDAGSFLSDLLVPILKQVEKVTGPVAPIARMLVTPIPGLSDLAGNDITLLDIAEGFGYLKPSTRKFIETVIGILDIIESMEGTTGNLSFDLGSYQVAGIPGAGSAAVAAGSWLELPATSVPPPSGAGAGIRSALARLRDLGFEFPILNLGELFKMFQGQPASLVEYTMPSLEFDFTFSQSISLYPPFLTLVLGGSVSARLDLTFGFDTYGILIYKESHNALDILQGIYIKDTDGNGVDVPEMVLSGGIFAGAAAGVSFGPIEVLAGVGGGLFIDLEFNLNDPDNDGKVRALEILANAERDIRCIFDVHGEIYLVLSAFLKVKAVFLKFEKQWDFPRINLYEFDLTCPPPILAHIDGTQLVLHVGANAHLREEIDTQDTNESVVIQHLRGTATSETVLVKWNGFQKEFEGISSIVADGGNGDDTLDARGVLAQVRFNGGIGDDTLYASDNPTNIIRGGAGNDTIVGTLRFSNTMIWGDDGNDTITGGLHNDVLRGGAGNDTILGNGGDDLLYGEDGNDRLVTLAGADLLLGGAGADVLDGGGGDDQLFGEDGNDKLNGGRGNDRLVGGAGADTLDGGVGDDVLVGDFGTIIDRFEVRGITGSGDDVLIGGAGSDVIFGGGGNDTLFGGTLTVSGTATPIEPDGVDFLDGGAGNDVEYADDAFAPAGVSPSGPSVSGRVWSDTDGDGIRSRWEPGMAGVTVHLYNATTQVLEDTMTTNASGRYNSGGLHAGDYYVKVLKLDAGQVFSPQDVGLNDALDSDTVSDPDTTSGQSAVFTLGLTGAVRVDAGLRGPPILVIDDVTQIEGSTLGTTMFLFTVSLSAPGALPVTVKYRTADVAATAVEDYTPIAALPSNTLVFTPGTTRLTIAVLVRADNVYEGNETFNVLLSDALEGNSTVLAIAKATGQGLILDDDPRPAITIDDRTVPEAAGGTTANFTLRLSNPSSQTITVGWTTADATNSMGENTPDSAHFGDDYVPGSGTVTFLPGVTEQIDVISVSVMDDALDERAEHLLVALANPVNATLLDGFGNATIVDDDTPPVATINPALVTVAEGQAGYHPATFTISLDKPVALDVTVDWATARGTATDAGSSSFDQPDFENATGSVTFSPGGPLSQTIPVNVLGDTSIEGTEVFFVNLIRAENATIGDNHAIVEITDDDNGADVGPWYVQFSDVNYSVSEDGGFAEITLVRATGSSEGVVVFYTQNGTATAGLDYASTRTLVRFAADETERSVFIPILDDTLIEGTETVNLFLRNPAGGSARGEVTAATLAILNDELLPTVSIDDALATEGDAGFTSMTFTLHLSASSEIPVHVPWSTNNRSALGGFDYGTASGVATFGIHALTATLTITVINDIIAEPVEEFVINLGLPDQATLADRQGLGTIIDNDKTPVSGRVFLDSDADAYFDPSEHGLANLQLNITDYSGANVTVLTDSAGDWIAAVLMGATSIQVLEPGLPPGLVISTGNNPQTVTIDGSNAVGGDVGYRPELLPHVPPDSIGEGSGGSDDTVFGGPDNDIINGGGGNDYLIGGHWLLGGVGPYDAYLAQASSSGRINLAPLPMNDGGTISGQAFNDANNSQVREGADSPVAGVGVNLFDSSYGFITGTITDANGLYSFSHLADGSYHVQFVAPPGFRFITSNAGTDLIDSDADLLTGFTAMISISGNTAVANVDAGVAVLPPVSPGPWALSFNSSAYNIWEKDGSAQIIIDRVPGSFEPLAVVFPQDGTALAGADYTAFLRRLVRFEGAATEEVVNVSITPDHESEGLETVFLYGQRPDAVLLIFDRLRQDDDRLMGSHGDDRMVGDDGFVDSLSGVATFIGGNGNDVLNGGAGFDSLHGQDGNDRLEGGAGDDLLEGGTGNDVYVFDADTPAGIDILNELPGAANGIDTLDFSPTTGVAVRMDLAIGGTAQDVGTVGMSLYLRLTLSDGNAIENLVGGGGDDTLLGNALDNTLTGGPGGDMIDGRSGTDLLAESRDVDFVLTNATLEVLALMELDTLIGIERVSLVGGPGDNRFDVSGWTGAPARIDGRMGTDTVKSSNDGDFILGDTTLTVSPGATFLLESIERADLTGGAGANLFDTTAFTGTAILNGNAGDDLFLGGPGDSFYIFGTDTPQGQDTIADSSGSDTLDFSTTTTLGVTVNLPSLGMGAPQPVNANLTLTLIGGAAIENVIGGSLNDTLTGNSLNNTLSGGAGDDTYVFNDAWGQDTMVELAGEGTDTLDFSSVTGSLTVAVAATLSVMEGVNSAIHSDTNVEQVIGGLADDAFTVTPSATTAFFVDGGNGSGYDILNLTAAGGQPITNAHFEEVHTP